MSKERAGRSAPNDMAVRRANSMFRGMLIIFAIGFLVLALVGYITTHEVAVIVLMALIYVGILLVGFWGKRHLLRDMGSR
jgi:hypothetical protein